MGKEMELLVKATEHFQTKINSTSSTAAVKCIKEKLTEAQLSLFRTTCFGKLLEMNDLKFSGQLVHNLLLRQIQSPVKSEMWFAVGGKTLRFSIQEFCLITGLECGPEPPVLKKEKGDGLEIDFIARKIMVYDSEKNFIGERKFKKFMEPLSHLLPLLLHATEFFSKRPKIHHKEDMSPWLVERCVNVPQQEKSDCGVFVIKFAEHLVHGQSIDSVQAEKAKYFRQQLCLHLW